MIQKLMFVLLFAAAGLVQAGELAAENGWIRLVPPVSANSAGYLTLTNSSARDRVVVSASSEIANSVELHTVVEQDGVSAMQQLDSIVVPANGSVAFQPGGNHLMFIGLKAPLQAGQKVPLILRFKDGDQIKLNLPVQSGQQDSQHMHHHH